jgi:hypothetical protein
MKNSIKDLIIIKDNFFEENIYKEILFDISRLKFTNRHATVLNKNNYQKRYFNVPLNINHFAVVEVLKKLKDYDLDLKIEESNYFLSTKHEEPSPHQDSVDVNCLIYLKGLHILNSGTGFYEKKDDDYVLNRHIGFKENRAVIFDAQIFHTSLQFNDVTGTRYIMANFLTYKK